MSLSLSRELDLLLQRERGYYKRARVVYYIIIIIMIMIINMIMTMIMINKIFHEEAGGFHGGIRKL